MQENKRAITGKFVTLTYDTHSVPITSNGFMTLRKKDLQDFFKRLRYYEGQDKTISSDQYNISVRYGTADNKSFSSVPIKYYAAAEYGSIRKRPHYHIILFNVKNMDNIRKAWTDGAVHIDEVNNNTIDYTLKYIQKPSNRHRFKAFDGEKEFSLMSKGLGDGFRTPEIDKFYQDNLDINYLVTDKGYKIPMPKKYRDEILSKEQKDEQIVIIKKAVEEENAKISEKQRILAAKVRAEILKRGQNRPID